MSDIRVGKKMRYVRMFCQLLMLLAVTAGCSTHEYLSENEMEIKKVSVITANQQIDTKVLRNYIRQLPGRQNGKKQHVAYDSIQTKLSCSDLTIALQNEGYLHAAVGAAVDTLNTGKHGTKCAVTYTLTPNEPYRISDVKYDFRDRAIDSLLTLHYGYTKGASHLSPTKLKAGINFSVAALNEERNMLTKLLQNHGYYKFNKDFIHFVADTVPGSKGISLTMVVYPYRANSNEEEEEHPKYVIRNINYQYGADERAPLRMSVMKQNTAFKQGEPYSAAALQETYRRFSRMQALRYTNIRFTELPDSVQLNALDCDIHVSPNKPNSISFQPEGTNTAGDLGFAASLTYENKNIFRGAETFSVQLRGAYEAITGLEGYSNSNYLEYGVESKLQFPRFIAPFLSRSFRDNIVSSSELSVSYNLQDRPEFHRRVFATAWRYRWSEPNRHTQYKFDLLDLNYIYMPWISETFKKEYIDDASNRNAILRYNYEDLFIMKMGFGITYSKNSDALKFNIETAGNLLHALSRTKIFGKNDEGQYTLFNIAYAQYIKGDLSYTHNHKLSPRSEIAFHGGLGIACPYGNSNVLPFEKRYFSGGANSVRGWAVRGLGPGEYKGTDGKIDFINQTGDIKLDLNVEYRFFMFWKIYGAAFVDAGNIWTIRDYEVQPGGQFRFDKFYKQLAAAYGLGVRLNFDYFILRFDMGMKAVNPAYETNSEHYPVVNPKLSRDFAFHFAVGLPF